MFERIASGGDEFGAITRARRAASPPKPVVQQCIIVCRVHDVLTASACAGTRPRGRAADLPAGKLGWRELMDLNPSAARSLGEGMEETLREASHFDELAF